MTTASFSGNTRSDGVAKWLQLLLVVSVSVNLLIAGAVFGGTWVFRHKFEPAGSMRGGPAMAMMGPVGKFVTTLSPERRAELREFIVLHQTATAEFNKSMLPVRREAAAAILANPFDRARLEAVVKRLYETEASARTANLASSSTFVEHLTDPERAAFLKELNWPGVPGAEKAAEPAPEIR